VKTVNTTYMKKCLFMLTALVTIGMFSCKENPYIGEPGDSSKIDSVIPQIVRDTIFATCAEAKEAAMKLPNNEASAELYSIDGYVQSAGYNSTISKGQQIFWVDDVKDGTKVFEAYYCNVPEGKAVPIGAKVRLVGSIMRYNDIAEMKNGNVEILEEP